MILKNFFLENNQKLNFINNFILTAIFIFILFLLAHYQLLYPTIIPMKIGNTVNLFADWSPIISANLCEKKGIDVYLQNPCDAWKRPHVYGPILLTFPFVENFKKFYFVYLPIAFNFLFVFIIVNFFRFNSKIFNLFSVFFIFSIPTILAIERANLDIIIFLMIILISNLKNLYAFHVFILATALTKFYPICLSIVFLFKKNFKKVMLNIILAIIMFSLIIFYYFDDLIKIYNVRNLFSSTGVYSFSFYSFVLVFKKIDNIFLQLTYLIPFYFMYKFFTKKAYIHLCENNFFKTDNFENRIYLLSSTTITVCYFLFSNFIYREIFLIGLLPWIIKNINDKQNTNFFNLYFFSLLLKFFISSIFVFINMNELLKSYYFIIRFFKHSIDTYIMFMVVSSLAIIIYNFIKDNLSPTKSSII